TNGDMAGLNARSTTQCVYSDYMPPTMSGKIEQLQGTWNVTYLEVDGQKMPDAIYLGAKIVVTGKAFVTIGMGMEYEGVLEVDVNAAPMAVDMRFTAGPEKGNMPGIFEVDEDTWRLCIAISGAERPK